MCLRREKAICFTHAMKKSQPSLIIIKRTFICLTLMRRQILWQGCPKVCLKRKDLKMTILWRRWSICSINPTNLGSSNFRNNSSLIMLQMMSLRISCSKKANCTSNRTDNSRGGSLTMRKIFNSNRYSNGNNSRAQKFNTSARNNRTEKYTSGKLILMKI